ncbi:TPA: signal peptidase I [Candidatus Berkelbacteria bacterium]|uniref:Signal peptidase I n=1 Tax=Berkelbacteria bacterium GW2011_GWE1_39_12 TaxID=1618337 RepID=A0A0G4B4Q9_9BACT|nr:MAG: putative signal peptidase I, signal peptidase I [Berkelbacteria bacterium GW2011_GWE1_39_12]HBO60317.1 signal peptidase I [Candidatus Berkelbacteria bacterium]
MKYLLLAIINAIYGVMLLLTLSSDTPGYYLVLIIGLVLTLMGIFGFIFWIRMAISNNKDEATENTSIESWFSLIKSFDIVLVIGLLFRAVILQPYIVEGSSMDPNFHDKEIMLVDKISYRFHEPQRGDVIIFHAPKVPGDDYIKRIVGLPGETIVISQGKVFVNGMLASENYLPAGLKTENLTATDIFRQTLGPNEFFVLGDNRDNSSDSRDWGILPKINIVGRAWYVLTPWNNHGFVAHNAAILQKDKLMKNIIIYALPKVVNF